MTSSSAAPAIAADGGGDGEPATDGDPARSSSGRDADTDPTLLHTRATVLVTFAVTGSSPVASTAG